MRVGSSRACACRAAKGRRISRVAGNEVADQARICTVLGIPTASGTEPAGGCLRQAEPDSFSSRHGHRDAESAVVRPVGAAQGLAAPGGAGGPVGHRHGFRAELRQRTGAQVRVRAHLRHRGVRTGNRRGNQLHGNFHGGGTEPVLARRRWRARAAQNCTPSSRAAAAGDGADWMTGSDLSSYATRVTSMPSASVEQICTAIAAPSSWGSP